MKYSILIKLGFILLLGTIIRCIYITKVPPHFSNDEISIAYDAYSIARTGRDEHNSPLPLAFQSHGTYKAPVYAYLLAPLTLVLPENNLTARLPSLVCGLLTVFIIFLISYLISQNSQVALISALILAVCPWHIYTSRMVLESNVALLFFSLGILLFLRKKYFSGDLMLIISMYAYHTEWLLAPFIILSLSLFLYKTSPRKIIISFCLAFLLALPLFFTFLAERNTGARANTEMIWNREGFNHPSVLLSTFFNNYFSYTNPGYLFFNGLNLFPSPGPYEQGLFLWPLIIPFFYGLINLGHINLKYKLFFIIWLIVSPVVASLTHDGNFIRNLVSVLPYTILISLGLVRISSASKTLFFTILIFLFLSFGLFGMIYLVHFPRARAESYQGYAPLAEYLRSVPDSYSGVIIDYRFGRYSQYSGVPHLYFGYYNRWNPKIIQNRINNPAGWFYGNFQVTWIDWNRIQIMPGYLYIIPSSNTPTLLSKTRLHLLRSFVDVSGMPSFEIWRGY